MMTLPGLQTQDNVFCQGPASAGSRSTLRMNGVGEREREGETERERETDRQTDQTGGMQQGLAVLYFSP